MHLTATPVYLTQPNPAKKQWTLTDDVHFTLTFGDQNVNLTSKKGTTTDLMSWPRVCDLFWSREDPRWILAALFHDEFLRQAIGTKTQADLLFFDILILSKTARPLAFIFYLAVVYFGKGAYQEVPAGRRMINDIKAFFKLLKDV